MHWMLFVCTGNFYRSRYAEALFNHGAALRGLSWRAFSRGLKIHWAPDEDLAPQTVEALRLRGIDPSHTGPTRVQIQLADLERADRVVVLDEAEHRPMILEDFPDWVDRVDYWTCQDLQWEEHTSCMPRIESQVATLLDELARSADGSPRKS
jgi:protein-tyrosine phosphatase